MFKHYFFTGLCTAIFASAGAILYASFYNKNLFDFSMVVGTTQIISICTGVGIIAAIGAWLFNRLLKSWGEFAFNALFCMVTMGSILIPIEYSFPEALLEKVHAVNGPDSEMFFPIYVIPLHFFPVLAWMSFKPLLFRNRS